MKKTMTSDARGNNLFMNDKICLPPIFKGTPSKIIITSEDSLYFPPYPGQEIRQRLTMHWNGNVSLTRYYAGDNATPSADIRTRYIDDNTAVETKTMKRYRGKPTEKLMEYIAYHFSEEHIPELICDAGIWSVELTNDVGEKFRYVDSLGSELIIGSLEMSKVGRRVLEIDDLWLFDGGEKVTPD